MENQLTDLIDYLVDRATIVKNSCDLTNLSMNQLQLMREGDFASDAVGYFAVIHFEKCIKQLRWNLLNMYDCLYLYLSELALESKEEIAQRKRALMKDSLQEYDMELSFNHDGLENYSIKQELMVYVDGNGEQVGVSFVEDYEPIFEMLFEVGNDFLERSCNRSIRIKNGVFEKVGDTIIEEEYGQYDVAARNFTYLLENNLLIAQKTRELVDLEEGQDELAELMRLINNSITLNFN